MNIETCNHWGENFLSFAWPMLWQSALLIVVVFALDVLSARKIRPAIRHALWMIVLVKLLLPPTLALPTGAAWWLWPAKPALTPVFKNTTVTFDQTVPDFVPPMVPMSEPPVRVDNSGWALVLSGAMSAGLLCWLVFKWLSVGRNAHKAGTAHEFENLFGEARQLAGLRGQVRLRLIDGAQSPAVYGLFRPVILLPRALAERLSEKQLRAVLLHEAIHVRRGDVWVNCAQTLLQIFYWWHPLLWLANARIRRLREEAVDDAVMVALRADADAYAPTLLEVAKFAFRRPLASLGLVGILESRSALRQRIERLVDFRPPRQAGVTLLSLCGIFAFSAVALPMGQAPVSTTDSLSANPPLPPASAAPTRTAVLIEGRFFWMRSSEVETLTAGLPAGSGQTGHAGNWTADVKKWDEINQRIDSLNLKPSGMPRIQTISGNAASLYVGNQTNWFRWNCTPIAADGRVDLTFKTEIAQASVPLHNTTYLIADGRATVENGGGVILRVPEPKDASSNLVLVIGVKTVEPAAAFLAAGTNTMMGASTGREAIYEKLNRIHLDVYYQGTTLDDALADLTKRSQELDSQHQGIRFSFTPTWQKPMINPATGLPEFGAADIRESLTLNNVSLVQVLDGLCLVADHPIKYSVEKNEVLFSAKTNLPLYEMRTFKVDPNLFYSRLKEAVNFSNILENAMRGGPAPTTTSLAKEFFQSLGVNLDPPKTLFFNDRMGVLFVYATPQDLDIVERAVQALGYEPPQIHIKARFIEAPSTADVIANWLPLGKNMDSGAGILTASTMTNVLHQLISQNGTEELAEPEATTITGREMQMRATEAQQVITNYLFQPSTETNVPAVVPQISNEEFGPMFDVVPIVMADGYTISLKTIGSRTQFFGYAEPKGFIGFTTNHNGSEIHLPVTLPAVQVSSASAQDALLYDGQTLVLFPKAEQLLDCPPDKKSRERIAQHIRRAEKQDGNKTLVVFVTVTLIDPAGNRIHSYEDMPFAQDAIPRQPIIWSDVKRATTTTTTASP